MSTQVEDDIKRWTAKRKTALILDIIQGKPPVPRHRFEPLQHASRVIGDWIGFYNHRRPYQALNMQTPAEAYALAA